MAQPAAPLKMLQKRSERHMFSTSDDQTMIKQVEATHAPDGYEFAVKPILDIVQDIFLHAMPTTTGILPGAQAQVDAILDEKALHSGPDDLLELVSITLSRISCELSCRCSGGDAHQTTITICKIVSSYSWDAKVVLALAAFAANYGEFWLVAQLCGTHPLAKGISHLKQLPETVHQTGTLTEALIKLINAMLDVAKCMVEFKELPSQYISPETPEMVAATAHIPTAVYWTIRSLVASASQLMGHIGMSHEYMLSTTEAWELSCLAHKVSSIHRHLMNQLNLCKKHIAEKQHVEAFKMLVHLFEVPHMDNMKILKALIYPLEDQLPLVDGTTKKRVSLDVLRRKNVLLLISDLELFHEELAILDQMYQEARQNPSRLESQYEVIWIPVVDKSIPWDDARQKQFESLQSLMTWYSVHHPSMIDPAVNRYIKEVWRFTKRPLLVVLDPLGKVVNPNAMHMMWIWGSLAFPFRSSTEETLWKQETWRMELLADTIDPAIFNWITEGKYICLYGGEDLDWIRKFTVIAKDVARAANIQLEMLYVGKSNPRDKVRKNNNIILAENISHILPDLNLIWFFWVRLESMWHSKMKHGMTVENDPIMKEIATMLSFDGSDQGWALISKGSDEMAKANGNTILKSLNEYDQWRELVRQMGFIPALNDSLRKLHSPYHCIRLILPGTTGTIAEGIVCVECGRPMEKFLMYRCCTD